jgi:hypothetical protein
MAKQFLRAPRNLAVFAIFASIGLAVACGDDKADSDSSDLTPPTGGAGGDSSGTGGSVNSTGGMGGDGTGGQPPSKLECYTKTDDPCFKLSKDCEPANNVDFGNVCQGDGSCVYKFDNSTLAKLVDGKVPPLQ